jgi:hypothetical protein
MCYIPFARSILQLSNGIRRHAIYRQNTRINSKGIDGTAVSQPAVFQWVKINNFCQRRPFRLLSPATKNLAMLLFSNPQRLKSLDVIFVKCGGHAIGPARHLHMSGNTMWGLVHTRVKNFREERHVIEKSCIIIVIL